MKKKINDYCYWRSGIHRFKFNQQIDFKKNFEVVSVDQKNEQNKSYFLNKNLKKILPNELESFLKKNIKK